MPNTPIVERVADHGIPAYAEEAPVASHMQVATTERPTESPPSHEQPISEQAATSQVTAEQAMPEQMTTEHQVKPQHPMVQEIGLTQHAHPVGEQTALEPTKTEPTRTKSCDTRHDSEDGEIGDSLDAADVAGEMRGSL